MEYEPGKGEGWLVSGENSLVSAEVGEAFWLAGRGGESAQQAGLSFVVGGEEGADPNNQQPEAGEVMSLHQLAAHNRVEALKWWWECRSHSPGRDVEGVDRQKPEGSRTQVQRHHLPLTPPCEWHDKDQKQVNQRNEQGRTPLHEAARHDALEAADWLLHHGAEVNALDDEGKSALHWAASGYNLALVRRLCEVGVDLQGEDEDGDTPLSCAVFDGSKEIVDYLMELKASAPPRRLVLAACKRGWTWLLQDLLLWEEVDLSQGDADQEPPLHQVLQAILLEQGDVEEWIDLLYLLLNKGAPVNTPNATGETPLMVALQRGRRPVVRREVIPLLLARGADLLAQDDEGTSVLHLACRLGIPELARQALGQGESPQRRDLRGRTPLHEACDQTPPLSYPAQKIVDLLLEAGARLNVYDAQGHTPLYLAVSQGNVLLVRQLLEAGAKVGAFSPYENKPLADSPLHRACELGEPLACEMALCLLAAGADANAPDSFGLTPLHLATQNQDLPLVRAMIDRGGDPLWPTPTQQNALDFAAEAPLRRWFQEQGFSQPAPERGTSEKEAERQGPFSAASGSRRTTNNASAKRAEVSWSDWLERLLQANPPTRRRMLQQPPGGEEALCLKPPWPYRSPHLHHSLLLGARTTKKEEPLWDGAGQLLRLLVEEEGMLERVLAEEGGCRREEEQDPEAENSTLEWVLLEEGGCRREEEFVPGARGSMLERVLSEEGICQLTDCVGRNLLHYAAWSNQTQQLAALLSLVSSPKPRPALSPASGLSLEAGDALGVTPLGYALAAGHKEAAQMLLQAGADPRFLDAQGHTSLHLAVRGENSALVALLCQEGIDPQQADDWGWTPLHLAASLGHLKIIQTLLQQNACPKTQNHQKQTPLHLALKRPTPEAALLLLRSIDEATIHLSDGHGRTALHEAASRGEAPLVRHLLQRGANPLHADRSGRLPLHEVASMCGVYEELLGGMSEGFLAGASGNLLANASGNLLANASPGPLRGVSEGVAEGFDGEEGATLPGCTGDLLRQTARLLLLAGSPPNAEDEQHNTPLHDAANANNLEVARLLLDAGADPCRPNSAKQTPLHEAAAYRWLEETGAAVVQLLLDYGANPTLQNRSQQTPLELASHDEVRQLLEQALQRLAKEHRAA